MASPLCHFDFFINNQITDSLVFLINIEKYQKSNDTA